MAEWFDNLLQQGKGLYQQGTNWATGNNLTSQDPNTIRAMNAKPFDPNARISDTSFSDRRYEDLGKQHPPLSVPRDISGMYAPNAGNIHTNPTPDWRGSYIHNQFGVPPNYAEMRKDVERDGIMATDAAQKKGNFVTKIKETGKKMFTPLMMMANAVNPLSPTSSNFNPMLEGQLENYQAQGFRVNEQGQAIDGPLAGKNLVSGFGTNDVTQMLRNRLQKLRGYDYQSKIKAQK